jgi:hypothetical protein
LAQRLQRNAEAQLESRTMQAHAKAAATPVKLGLFECFALVAAVVLQIASLMTSLQDHGCGAAPVATKTPVAKTLGAAAPSCRG